MKNFIDGMSVEEYYRLLNGKTFFWIRKERLERLLNGKAFRNRSHCVLTVDTSLLVSKYQEAIWLSRINFQELFLEPEEEELTPSNELVNIRLKR